MGYSAPDIKKFLNDPGYEYSIEDLDEIRALGMTYIENVLLYAYEYLTAGAFRLYVHLRHRASSAPGALVSVGLLSRWLGVSERTVFRDLRILEEGARRDKKGDVLACGPPLIKRHIRRSGDGYRKRPSFIRLLPLDKKEVKIAEKKMAWTSKKSDATCAELYPQAPTSHNDACVSSGPTCNNLDSSIFDTKLYPQAPTSHNDACVSSDSVANGREKYNEELRTEETYLKNVIGKHPNDFTKNDQQVVDFYAREIMADTGDNERNFYYYRKLCSWMPREDIQAVLTEMKQADAEGRIQTNKRRYFTGGMKEMIKKRELAHLFKT